jgi:hypothetical protein
MPPPFEIDIGLIPTTLVASGERMMLLSVIARAVWDYRSLLECGTFAKELSGDGVRRQQMQEIRDWVFDDNEDTELSIRWIANLVATGDPEAIVNLARRALDADNYTRGRRCK